MGNPEDETARKKIDIILMAKPPEIGEAKTRLSMDVGDKVAMEVYSQLLNDRLVAMSNCFSDRNSIYTYGDEKYLRKLTMRGFHVIKDLGRCKLQEKVYEAFTESLLHYSYTLMIVSDDPSLTGNFLDFVIPKVLSNSLVIGPTRDGGLYLIGISRAHLSIVEGLPFGKQDLCDSLIKRAIKNDFTIEILPKHLDVDSEEDMQSLGMAT